MDDMVRLANGHDAEAVAWIYNSGIASRTATFETEPTTAERMLDQIRVGDPFPVLVAEMPGRGERSSSVAGWAALTSYSSRPLYTGVAAVQVYVEPESHGLGIGAALVGALEEEAVRLGLHKITCRIFEKNVPARRMFQSAGYREVGTLVSHAQLEGEWIDVLVMEKLLETNLHDHGVAPADLPEGRLVRELETLHRTRHEALLYGSEAALHTHSERMLDLEQEYLRRHPHRDPAPGRTRVGARSR